MCLLRETAPCEKEKESWKMNVIRYDVVIDERKVTIFGGTPVEVHEWLRQNTWAVLDARIRIKLSGTGNLVSARDYKNIRGT
jgi:hypothetical protein